MGEFEYEEVIKGLRDEIDQLKTQRSIRDETIARLRGGIAEAIQNFEDSRAKFQRGEITLGEAYDMVYGGTS